MRAKRVWPVIMLLCVGIGLMTTGCRTKGTVAENEELLPTDVLAGDYPLASWDKPGELVTGLHWQNVLFEYDSAQIDRGERSKIEDVGRYMKEHSRYRVLLEGNCDERGSREYNMALGERRALAVRAYLIGLGMDGENILTKSFGEEKPLDQGHSEDAWRANRRVEFVVYR